MSMRIVVAANNRSLSLGLAGLDYDVVDVDPGQLATWGDTAKEADVLVVGVDDPESARQLVSSVDALRPGMPSLVVCGDATGWPDGDANGLNVEFLPLPITRPSLVAAIDRLTTPVAAPPTPLATPSPPPSPPPPPPPT